MAIKKKIKDLLFKLRYGFRGVPFQVGEYTIRLDESLRRWDLKMESAVHQVMEKSLKDGDVFIDIGANFGMHTVYSAKLVGQHGAVYAFEPVEANLNLLRRNTELSGVSKQVNIIPKAVSNSTDSFLEFYLPPEEVAVTASLKPIADDLQKIRVGNIRLDDFWQDIAQPVKVIKIDVEGAELEVLKGAKSVLTQWHPLLIIEVHGFALPSFDASVAHFQDFLTSLGYQETRLEGDQFSGEEYYQAIYH